MKLVMMSDTHNRHREVQVPEGDCVIHAGDFTNKGTIPEVRDFLDWYSKLPHKYKIYISGNHEKVFGEAPDLAAGVRQEFPDLIYLQDEGINLEGINIWGSPWRAVDHFSGWVFSDFDENLGKKWGLVAEGVDVLVTHGPPYGYGDVIDDQEFPLEHLGSTTLLEGVKKLKPKLHVFGHIHQGHGTMIDNKNVPDTRFMNVAICDGRYDPVNKPLGYELKK